MADRSPTVYERLSERYAAGEVPWDNELPPPEVLEFVPTLPPGRALDLGSGYGRASIYMAGLGWQVDGVDFIPQAVATAADRAESAGVTVRWHIAQVTDLDFLAGPYDYALDVGCGHNLDDGQLRIYRDHLRRLLKPGGYFMFYARLFLDEDNEDAGPRGLRESTLLGLFVNGFDLVWARRGQTEVEDQPPWPSGWFLFRRR